MINKERLINEFMSLVRIDSESGHEGQIAELLARNLQNLGCEVYMDNAGAKTGSETGNIIACLPGKEDVPVVLFSAHLDTVSPGKGVHPILEKGIIRSDGTTILGADDKAGIAAILEAIRTVREDNLPHGNLEFVFTVCEEAGLAGIKFLDFSRLKAEMGYVLDSNGSVGTIVNRGPAQDEIYAEIRGKSAHAGINPEDGVNAIQTISKSIADMQLGRIDHETTANIGVISGGVAINIVPDTVMIKGECRSLQEEKRIRQTASMCRALEQAANDAGAKVNFKVETVYPAMHVHEEALVVRLAKKAALAIALKAVVKSTGGGSDTHIFNQNNIPAVNLGIAMQKVHTVDEFITVNDLVLNASFVVSIMTRLARSSIVEGELSF